MNFFLKSLLAAFLVLFLSSCASKNKEFFSQSVLVFINTKDLKINDAGFLKQGKKALNLEIYKFGRPFFELIINDKICLNAACYQKKDFNKKFLKNAYYDELLEDILKAKPLYNGKNLENQACGFIQKINSTSYNITYELCNDKVSFFDKLSGTKIILKKINAN
ncbi:MAG: hypothetical protein J1D99_04445 [Campylobacter sp.]|nr:hypothetical protein [Campylobacter sp.]